MYLHAASYIHKLVCTYAPRDLIVTHPCLQLEMHSAAINIVFIPRRGQECALPEYSDSIGLFENRPAIERLFLMPRDSGWSFYILFVGDFYWGGRRDSLYYIISNCFSLAAAAQADVRLLPGAAPRLCAVFTRTGKGKIAPASLEFLIWLVGMRLLPIPETQTAL